MLFNLCMEYVHAYSCKQCMLSARVKSCQGLNRQCIIVAHCRLQSCKLNETENILIKDMTLLPSLSSLQAKLIFPTQNYIMLIPKKLAGVPFVSLNRAEYCRCMSQTQIIMGPAILWLTCFNRHYSVMHSWKGVRYP